MDRTFEYQPIAVVRNKFTDKASTPRGGAGVNEAEGIIEVSEGLSEGLSNIEEFSHLYIIWAFHEVESFSLLSQPPIDNRKHGVFATRSPYRPNPIGLTTVELLRREGNLLHVKGIDMLDGTPVLDIKPFMPSAPADGLRLGWFGAARARIAAGKQRLDTRVAVVGASNNPKRYSYMAFKLLLDEGYTVLPINPGLQSIEGVDVEKSLEDLAGIDTVTLYINPALQSGLEEAVIKHRVRRVIFNPGTENPSLMASLSQQGVEVVEACTLVMLRTDQF